MRLTALLLVISIARPSFADDKQPRGNDAMVIAGMTLFTAAYLTEFGWSAYQLDYLARVNASPAAYAEWGALTQLPVVSPIVAGSIGGGGYGFAFISVGMAQLGGLIMAIVGSVDKPRFDKSRANGL